VDIKPQFYVPEQGTLIKATKPFERLNLDFKGSLTSRTRNVYMFVVVDEYSRFPFCFACPDMLSSAVVKYLDQRFSLCGMPSYIHSDLGRSRKSCKVKEYLIKRGVTSIHSTPYHRIGNSQVERYNGMIWKAIRLALKSHNLPVDSREAVLSGALLSIPSLLCTSTNATRSCVRVQMLLAPVYEYKCYSLLCTSTNATRSCVRVQMLLRTNYFLVLIDGLRMGNRCLHGCLGLALCF